MKKNLKEITDKSCVFLFFLSVFLFLGLAFKVVKIRSECTKVESKISSMVGEISRLKDENKRLSVEFYKLVKPKTVDNETRDLKFLHENEVKYLK